MSNPSPPVSFGFGENTVRVHTDANGSPWFVAKDVALALEYEWNGQARIAHVPEEWRGVTSVVTPRGNQDMLTLSEQGLYFFLGRSDKPKALPFQKWLAGEVLPTLRKTGKYEKPDHPLPRGRKPRYREEEHCTHGQAQRLEAAVNHWCALTGIHRRDALAAIRVRFGLRIFDRPPLRLHEDILRWIGEQCGKDVSSLPTGQAATTRSPRREAPPRASPLSPAPLPVRPPLSLRELMRDAEDCQRRLGILCHGLALTSNETARRWGKPYEKARLQDAIRDNLNAACAASQTALSLLKGIRNLCLAAQ